MQQKQYIPAFTNLRKEINSLLLQPYELLDAKNVYFDKGKVIKRAGYVTMGTNLPLNGRVSLITEYSKLRSVDRQVIACTSGDAYKFDSATNLWLFLTPSYQTGTAACSGTAVTGTGTTWDTGWPASTYYIKFGTNTVNGTGTPDTWHLISSVGSTTALTLAASAGTIVDGTYVIRKCFALASDTDWDCCYVIETPGGSDELWGIFTNGTTLYKYTGTGQFQTLAGTSLKSKKVKSYYEHIMLGWVIDASKNLPQSVYWNNRAYPEDWTTGSKGYVDLLRSKAEITGMEILNERLYVVKDDSWIEGYFTGVATGAFTFIEDKIFKGGCTNGRTLINTSREIFHLGLDNIYSFNGFQRVAIGDDIAQDLIASLNKEYAYKNWAFEISDKFLYCLCVVTVDATEPNKVYVFNWQTRKWTIWQFGNYLRCFGNYTRENTATWESVADSVLWTDMEGEWLITTLTAYSKIYAFGDSAGYVYKMDFTSATDNGTNIQCMIETKDFETVDRNGIPQTDRAIKLLRTLLNFESASGDISIKVSTDKGLNWSAAKTFTQTTSKREYFQRWLNYGNQIRFKIENITNSDFIFLNMMFQYNEAGRI